MESKSRHTIFCFVSIVASIAGQATPTQAPDNFKIIETINASTVLVSWDLADPFSVRNRLESYKIQTWTIGGNDRREIDVGSDTSLAVVDELIPNTKNYFRVCAHNRSHDGPYSKVIEIVTPQGTPGPVQDFEVYALGTTSLYLTWNRPENPNGILTGYRIYYQKVNGTVLEPMKEKQPHISNPDKTTAKLSGLIPGANYRIRIRATTEVGEGEDSFVEESTFLTSSYYLAGPQFRCYQESSDNEKISVRVEWIPDVGRYRNYAHSGSHFFVQYKPINQSNYENSTPGVLDETDTIIRGLTPGKKYIFRVASIDETNRANFSDIQEIAFNSLISVPHSPFLTGVTCGRHDAKLMWKTKKDNWHPIVNYTIMYSSSINPYKWETAILNLRETENSYTVSLLPWANYTFRVIAKNEKGSSTPSIKSENCNIPPDVPFKNPDNVRVHRSSQHKIVVYWSRMAKIEHNGPAFGYIVQWKQENGSNNWDYHELYSWTQNNYTITHQPTYYPYLVRVWAVNAVGKCNTTPKENRIEEYPGQYIATRYCSKIKDIAQQNKCLDNLKPILNSSNSNINSDVVVQVLENFEEVIVDDDNTCTSNSGYDVLQTSQSAYNVAFRARDNTTNSDWVKITDAVLNVFGNLIVNPCQWKKVQKDERPSVFTKFMDLMDSATLNLAEKISDNKNGSKIFYPLDKNDAIKSNIVVYLGTLETRKDNFTGSDIYVDDENPSLSSISVQIDSKQRNSLNFQSRLKYAAVIRPIYVESIINDALKSTEENWNYIYSQSRDFNGKLVSLAFKKSIQLKNPKVRIQFAHTYKEVGDSKIVYRRKLHSGEKKEAIAGSSMCAYWDTNDNFWSTSGCHKNMSNSLTTICECNHLTAFSVLAGFNEYSGKDFGLQILTWTLCTLSIVCLLLSLTSFAVEKQGRNAERKITIHLCVALIGGNILLIFGDKDNFFLSNTTCTIFGILTHFLWLCAFGWMAVEGIHLYIQVVKVFPPTTNHLFKIYCFIGYGIPLLIVSITALIGFLSETENIYAGVMFCWLQGRYIWAFMAPALLVCVGNTFVLISAIRIAKNRKSTAASVGAANKKSESNRKLIKGTVSLTVILGISWIFGILTLVDVQGHIYLSYIFTILNASQGMFIFIFRCCLNKQLRLAMRGLLTQAIPNFSSKSTEINNESSGGGKNKSNVQTSET